MLLMAVVGVVAVVGFVGVVDTDQDYLANFSLATALVW